MSKKNKNKKKHKRNATQLTKTNVQNTSTKKLSSKKPQAAPNIWENKNIVVPKTKRKKLEKIEIWNFVIAILLMLYGLSPLGRTIFIFDVQQNVFMFYLAIILPFMHLMAGFGLLCRSIVGHRLLLACSIWNMLCTYIPCRALVVLLQHRSIIPHISTIFGELIGICAIVLVQLCIMWIVCYILYDKTLKKLYPSNRWSPLQNRNKRDIFDKLFDHVGKRI